MGNEKGRWRRVWECGGGRVGGWRKGGWGEIIVLVTLSLRSIKPEMVGKTLNGENKYKMKAYTVCS